MSSRPAAEIGTPLSEVDTPCLMVTRVVEQKGVVAVRRVDFGVGDVAAIVEQRLDDFARALGRKTPVGGERDDQETGRRRFEGEAQIAAMMRFCSSPACAGGA